MEISKVLMLNYLPYAKGVIIGRAIPSIDGLKPVQRRVLYTMYNMSLLNKDRTKSANIVGQTMKLHPHGDSAIYETMVRMSVGHAALNVPYVDSKGNFGKFYSKNMAYAASRYTEAKLAEICRELFDGIDENAVDFVDNYDNTLKEPTLLPVKFPSILVNASSGIAVGTSSNIPSFGLKEVCDSTIGLLKGSIKTSDELMKVLGTPEFTTGGFVHASDADLANLCDNGFGSFVVSGTVTTYTNKIVINEIPYKAFSENIITQITQYAKSGELREVSNVNDDSDLSGFRITVDLKRGANTSLVLQKLCRLTDLRLKMSFRTRVIVEDRCQSLGLMDLLNKWIEFRLESLDRIYTFRLAKYAETAHLLGAWEKINNHARDVALLITTSKSELKAKEILMSTYNLDDIQANYLLDLKTRKLTQDNVNKALKDLANIKNEVAHTKYVISSRDEKYRIMIEDLTRIGTKYGTKAKTHRADVIEENQDDILEAKKIDDTLVSVVYTKSGYIKRLITLRDEANFEEDEDDPVLNNWTIKNDNHILVFTYSGNVHKIIVDSIDASRGSMKEKVAHKLNIDEKDIMYVDSADDYSGYFNMVMPNGRGVRVMYSKASGNRAKYKNVYDAVEPGRVWITKANKFFMITNKRKAAYADLSSLGIISNRTAFKIARVNTGDSICGLQPIEFVPDISKIDLAKYAKSYCISIGTDILWPQETSTSDESEAEDTISDNN